MTTQRNVMFNRYLQTEVATINEASNIACSSPAAIQQMQDLAKRANYKRYEQDNSLANITAAIRATSSYFVFQDVDYVQKHLKHIETGEPIRDVALEQTRCPLFINVAREIISEIVAQFPEALEHSVSGAVERDLIHQLTLQMHRKDASRPIDAIMGTEIVVCYIPNFSERNIQDTMTSHWDHESSSTTIIPDHMFRNLLKLTNVSSHEWKDAVERIHGVRVDESDPMIDEDWEIERERAWSEFNFTPEDGGEPIIDVEELVNAVDSCPMGFTPLLAFSADAGQLCTRDWGNRMDVSGSILGLHDFVHGTGDIISIPTTNTIAPTPKEMMVAEGVTNDFLKVHGLEWGSFKCDVRDNFASTASSLTP